MYLLLTHISITVLTLILFISATATIVKTKCMQEREEAQAIARKPTVGIFIPECRLDGSYSETQCHAATGYCWCVTNDGKPIAGTSISGKRPSCKRKSTRGKDIFIVIIMYNWLQLFTKYLHCNTAPISTASFLNI